MAATYILEHETFGDLEVLERRDARGLSLRIHEGGVIRVTVRPGTSKTEILEFIDNQTDWIEKSIVKIDSRGHQKTLFSPQTPFSTRQHELQLSSTSPDNRAHLKVSPGLISVIYPSDVNPTESDVVQELARKGIAFALKVEAQKFLPQRVRNLADLHGFKFKTLSFKDLKSRWGSCSTNGEICLNVQLMRLPDHLIDHIILHELCHTVEMNHGTRFHKLLNSIENGREAEFEREVRKWRTQLF